MHRLSHLLGVGWPLLLLPVAVVVCAQSMKPPQQPLRLPDPTPRPQAVDTIYSNLGTSGSDIALRVRQGQAAALLRQQNRAQVLSDAGGILALADQLRYDAAHPDGAGLSPLDRMAIQKIEKLAKDVRTRMSVAQ